MEAARLFQSRGIVQVIKDRIFDWEDHKGRWRDNYKDFWSWKTGRTSKQIVDCWEVMTKHHWKAPPVLEPHLGDCPACQMEIDRGYHGIICDIVVRKLWTPAFDIMKRLHPPSWTPPDDHEPSEYILAFPILRANQKDKQFTARIKLWHASVIAVLLKLRAAAFRKSKENIEPASIDLTGSVAKVEKEIRGWYIDSHHLLTTDRTRHLYLENNHFVNERHGVLDFPPPVQPQATMVPTPEEEDPLANHFYNLTL